MPKRDVEDEPLDEQVVEPAIPRVGERLKAAREEEGLSLEDIAAQTRIPQRHLESIETSDWEHLPAPTYTIGFAKSYAASVGLDRNEIGDQLREEMGGQRFVSSQSEVIEAADPARTMPKWLVISAVVAVILLIVIMSVLNRRALEQPSSPAATAGTSASSPAHPLKPATQQPAPPQGTPQGPVVLTATGPAWIQVSDQGKTLFEGQLQPGQAYTVPATAAAPLLKAGKPEALKITVGSAIAPPVGPPGKVASKVSLKAADLLRGGAQAAAPATPAAPAQAPANAAAQ
jgi:cytoskeleton protein RodZ